MKLSMWIIANALESFEPQVNIRSESPRILRSARLAHATGCVYVYQEGSDCIYSWEEDTIRLPDLSAREGFELLQSLFDAMFDWHTQLCDAIEKKDFQKAVDLCHGVFHNPINLSDGNHHCLALSSQYGPGDVDPEWAHLKKHGCSSPESILQIHRTQISHHLNDHLVRYRFDPSAGLFNCTCAAVVHEGMPVGYLTVLEKDAPVNTGHIQLLSLVAQLLSPVMAEGLELSEDATPTLKLLLDGKTLPRKNAAQLTQNKKWSQEHTYRVLLFQFSHTAAPLWKRQNYFLVGSLSAVFPEDLCGLYQGKLVIIANDSLLPQEQRLARLEQQLSSSDVAMAVSLPVPGFSSIPELYRQALFALERGAAAASGLQQLDFYPLAIDYLIRSSYSPALCLAACHPDVYALYRTDEVLYRTLWVYLVQDRSVTRTIEHLFVHKNTLLNRLRKIEENLCYRLSDPYSREYMRLSFSLLERHAGLPHPPQTPFPPVPNGGNL